MTGAVAAERVDADLTRQFMEAATLFRRRGSVLYAEVSARAAHDATLLALASQARPGQPAVHMLLAAVHFLILGDADSPLGRFFHAPMADQAFPAFRDYCIRHADDIRRILATRTLQMSNADRAGYLMPAVALAAQQAGEPLSLIEVGCSAGLLTIFDHYSYDYGPLGRLGDPAAGALVAGCEFRGAPPALPDRLPRIGFRVGLDLSPVDPRRADERRWIMALTPPHLTEAGVRLKAALEYRSAFDLRVIEGDALISLPPVLREAPDPVCLFHSSCLYQWPIEARAAFSRLLLEASKTRTIHRISIEHRDFPMAFAGTTAETNAPPPDMIEADLVANIDLVVYERGRSRVRRLGYYDGQGQIGRWVA